MYICFQVGFSSQKCNEPPPKYQKIETNKNRIKGIKRKTTTANNETSDLYKLIFFISDFKSAF